MKQENNVQIRVSLGEDMVPERIEWKAMENQEDWVNAKAFLLSIFEESTQDTLKLDLWTKEFQMGEMDRFMYYTLRSLCETYYKATNNQQLSNEFQAFVEYFGKSTEILK